MMSVKESTRQYREQVQRLERLLENMKTVSRAAAGRQAGHRPAWASVLFTRLCVMGTTLSNILPRSFETGKEQNWDYSSIANITRSILECCLIFHYLGVDCADDYDAWRDRLNLVHLHDATARVALFKTLIPNQEEADAISKQREEVRERLVDSPRIKALPEKLQKKLLSGERMSFEIQDDTIRSMGKDVELFRAWYRVLSAHTHSLPFSFHRALEGMRGTGVETRVERNWATLTIEYLCEYLSASLSGMLTVFPDIPDPRLQRASGLKRSGPIRNI